MYTAKDLINSLLAGAGGLAQVATLTSPTDDSTYLLEITNYHQKRIGAMRSWDYLRSHGEIQILAKVTGTISGAHSADDTLITFSSAIVVGGSSSVYIGAWLKIAGLNDYFQITGVPSSSTVTISPGLPAAVSDTTAVEISQSVYPVPAEFDAPLSVEGFVTAPWSMNALDPERFLQCAEARSSFTLEQNPANYTLFGWNETFAVPRRNLRVDPFPTATSQLNISFFKKTTTLALDTDVLTIPDKMVPMLKHFVLGQFYTRRRGDLTKGQFHKIQAAQALNTFMGGNETTSETPSFAPRTTRQDYVA